MKLKKTQVIAGLLGLVVVVTFYFILRTPSQYAQHLDSKQDGMRMLGEFLSKERPGENVLVVSNPFVLRPGASDKIKDHDAAGFGGLRSGFPEGTQLEQVYPEITDAYQKNPNAVHYPPNALTPLSFVVKASSLDALAEAQPESKILVSLIGLPVGIKKLNIWKPDHPAAFAFLRPDFRILGGRSEVIAQFEKGKILAALIDDKATGDPLIVTKFNIVEVIKTQPKSLGL
jgi:hypothetical protein